jgi:hypothetical protein
MELSLFEFGWQWEFICSSHLNDTCQHSSHANLGSLGSSTPFHCADSVNATTMVSNESAFGQNGENVKFTDQNLNTL